MKHPKGDETYNASIEVVTMEGFTIMNMWLNWVFLLNFMKQIEFLNIFKWKKDLWFGVMKSVFPKPQPNDPSCWENDDFKEERK